MDYYKILNADVTELSQAMAKYVQNNPKLMNCDKGSWISCSLDHVLNHVPILKDFFIPFGLTIKRVSFFVMDYKVGAIHIDDDKNNPIRINFPVLNCSNTETCFYTVESDPHKRYQPNTFALHQFDPTKCKKVAGFELTRATLIKTQEPHQVLIYHDNLPRISCTVAFHEDLTCLFDRL